MTIFYFESQASTTTTTTKKASIHEKNPMIAAAAATDLGISHFGRQHQHQLLFDYHQMLILRQYQSQYIRSTVKQINKKVRQEKDKMADVGLIAKMTRIEATATREIIVT